MNISNQFLLPLSVFVGTTAKVFKNLRTRKPVVKISLSFSLRSSIFRHKIYSPQEFPQCVPRNSCSLTYSYIFALRCQLRHENFPAYCSPRSNSRNHVARIFIIETILLSTHINKTEIYIYI